MNTIATNRCNNDNGPAIALVIERAADELQKHSPGCALIDGLMADCWDGGDPWDSAIEAAFALEYACQYHGWPTSPEFSSPYTTGDPDDGYLYIGIRDAMRDHQITPDDIPHARDVLGRMLHAFKLAGLDY